MSLKAKSKFFSFLKLVFFVAICFAVSFAVIFPLWAFASNAPRVYSAVVLVLAAALLLRKIVIFILKKSKTKKTTILFLSAVLLLNRNSFTQEKIINVDTSSLPVIQNVEKIDVERERIINGQKVIQKAKDDDPILKQYDSEVEQNNKLIRQLKTPNINFYAYTAKKSDTIAKLSARLCVTPDSFVIISEIPSQEEELAGKTLIIPNAKGLFIPDPEKNTGKETSLEILLQKNREGLLDRPENLWYNIKGRQFVFIPDDMFTPTERAFFLDPAMVVPVKNYRISSEFGTRKDPITNTGRQFHRGVDMAVPNGTEVVACKGGRILDTGENEVYGKWILIEHQNGMSSFYAHLSYIVEKVQKGALVRSGEPIGSSGSTGQVTGPHLHFEVRKNGNPVDPKKYISS